MENMADYIDREKLLKNFSGIDLTKCVKYGNKTEEQTHHSYDRMMMYEIADAIKDAPAADVEPVRHGRWIKLVPGDGEPYCSECKAKQLYLPYVGYFYSKYCPYCGAKMEG